MERIKKSSTQTKESGEAARVGGKKLALTVGKLLGMVKVPEAKSNLFIWDNKIVLIKTARKYRNPRFVIPNSLFGKFEIAIFAHNFEGFLSLCTMKSDALIEHSKEVQTGNLSNRARSIYLSQSRSIGSKIEYDHKKWRNLITKAQP